MLIPKKDRKEIYTYLFKEGVLWAPKDFALDRHPEIVGVRNLYVIKSMQSFKDHEYVTERYAWRNYYWFLTDSGIEYLREYLNIPSEVVPATHLRQAARTLDRGAIGGGRGGPRDGPGGRPGGGSNWRDDREDYRAGPREGGGFGRGGGAPGGAYQPPALRT